MNHLSSLINQSNFIFVWPCIISKRCQRREPTRRNNNGLLVNPNWLDMFRATILPIIRSIRLCNAACGMEHAMSCRLVAWERRNQSKFWVTERPIRCPVSSFTNLYSAVCYYHTVNSCEKHRSAACKCNFWPGPVQSFCRNSIPPLISSRLRGKYFIPDSLLFPKTFSP
jgi:hypothetical protein